MTIKEIAVCPEIGTQKRAAGFRNDMSYRIAGCYWNIEQYIQAKSWAEKYLKNRLDKKLCTENSVREVRVFIADCKDHAVLKKAMDVDDWPIVCKVSRKQLRKYPNDPHLWNCLILSYYERYEYRKSLEISSKAMEECPDDGCIQFNHAGALQMLERYDEAMEIFGRLARCSEKQLIDKYQAADLAEARQLKNDARYRLGRCYAELGNKRQARYWLNKYIEGRKAGMGGIYNLNTVRRKLRELSADCPAD